MFSLRDPKGPLWKIPRIVVQHQRESKVCKWQIWQLQRRLTRSRLRHGHYARGALSAVTLPPTTPHGPVSGRAPRRYKRHPAPPGQQWPVIRTSKWLPWLRWLFYYFVVCWDSLRLFIVLWWKYYKLHKSAGIMKG